jgi:hypothetical protein
MRLRRGLLRLELPRQALTPWRRRDGLAVLLIALLVALLSSWPWLVEPSLRPGVPAPFTVRAPKMATVVDSDALEQRRSQLGPRTHVQVVDPRINRELEQGLERQLQAIQTLASTNQEQVAPLDLSPEERERANAYVETLMRREAITEADYIPVGAATGDEEKEENGGGTRCICTKASNLLPSNTSSISTNSQSGVVAT